MDSRERQILQAFPHALESSMNNIGIDNPFKPIQLEVRVRIEKTQENEISSEYETHIKQTFKRTLTFILKAIEVIKKTPIYMGDPTLAIYQEEFAQSLAILEEKDLNTKELLFHIEQKLKFLPGLITQFEKVRCIAELKQSQQILKEIRQKLLLKLQR